MSTIEKKIIVTGGTGFIGSYLCERLVGQQHHVICVDNFSTGKWENISHLLKKKNFLVREHDITNPLTLHKVDEIYNLACPASPIAYQKDPIGTFRTAVIGTQNMLDLARFTGAKMLQASTSEVYGDPQESPQRESYHGSVNPVGIRSCYDEGKRAAETLCTDYRRIHGLDIKIVRIFNTYGERMRPDDGRVVSQFMKQILSGEPVTVFGDGLQTRSFCYVSDTIDAMTAVMNSRMNTPVNIGNPNEITIKELAHLLFRMTGIEAEMTACPFPEDDPHRRCPDITLIQSQLGWTPKVPLETGLQKMFEYFRAHSPR